MKVTTDSLVFGSWLTFSNEEHLLDVGCGSGVLSLMALQKTHQSVRLTAIDIDEDAVAQTNANLASSPWSERAAALKTDFLTYKPTSRYSHIFANPPFFPSAVGIEQGHKMDAKRHLARQQSGFTPQHFFTKAAECCSNEGAISLVYPRSQYVQCIEKAAESGLFLQRSCHVRSHKDKVPYLSLMTFVKQPVVTKHDPILSIYAERNEYSREYRALCQDFYLRF